MKTIEDKLIQSGFSIDSRGDYVKNKVLVKRSNIDGSWNIYERKGVVSPPLHIVSTTLNFAVLPLIEFVEKTLIK